MRHSVKQKTYSDKHVLLSLTPLRDMTWLTDFITIFLRQLFRYVCNAWVDRGY